MKRGIYVLTAGLVIFALSAGLAFAQITELPIEPSGTGAVGSSGVADNSKVLPGFMADAKGLAHSTTSFSLNGNDAFLKYNAGLFPLEGTLGFFASTSVAHQPGKTLLDTVGILGARNGDMEIKVGRDDELLFQMFGNGAWHYLSASNVDWTNGYQNSGWNLIAVSYGSQGMKMWVNGSNADTAFYSFSSDYAGQRYPNYMYFGDNRRDNAIPRLNGNNPKTNQPYDIHRGWVGNVDWIRTSANQSDANIYTIPEPGSIAALLGGLLSSAAIFRRRRS